MALPSLTGQSTLASAPSSGITNSYGSGTFHFRSSTAAGTYSVDGGGVWFDLPGFSAMTIKADELLTNVTSGTLTVTEIPNNANYYL